MSEQRLVPKRRFKGFEGEWEEVQFGSLAEIVRGASPRPIQDPKWFDESSDIGWLRMSDVTVQEGRNHNIEQKLSLLGQKKTRVVKESHLLLSIAATVGKPVINYVPTGVHDGFLIFFKPKFDIEYMYQWLEMFQNNWLKYGQLGSQVNLNSNIVKHHYLKIPSNNEQQKIGRFFKLLDKRIANQEGKIAKLKDIKSAYLTEMFPQEGETVPKRRFKGFEEDWSLVTVRDLAQSYYNGGTPRTSISEYWNGDIPWIQSSDLSEDIITITKSRNSITKLGLQMSAAKLIPKNSIAVVTRVGVGKLAFIPYEYTTSQDFLSLSDLVNEPYFTTYVLYDLLKRRKNSVQGTSIKGMTKDELLSWSLFIAPNYKEQQKIGAFFKNLDNQIETEEKKLAKLKAMKEAYLEEMFV